MPFAACVNDGGPALSQGDVASNGCVVLRPTQFPPLHFDLFEVR